MVGVTMRAKEALAQLRAQVNMSDPEIGLRLSAENSVLALVPDRVKPGDQVIEMSGAKILLVADDLPDTLQNVTIDFRATDDGPEFVVAGSGGARRST